SAPAPWCSAFDLVHKLRVHICRALAHRPRPVGGHDHASRSQPQRSGQRRHSRAHRRCRQDRHLLRGTKRPEEGQHDHPRGTLRPPQTGTAPALGFKSPPSYDDSRNAVLQGTAADLLPQRTGPHTPSKRTKELEALIIGMRFETNGTMYEIADTLTHTGCTVSARLVGQVLADYGLSKKNG